MPVRTGRIKGRQRWQADAFAGWPVGRLAGWFSHSLERPILIQALPHGFELGLWVML